MSLTSQNSGSQWICAVQTSMGCWTSEGRAEKMTTRKFLVIFTQKKLNVDQRLKVN